MTKLYSIFEKFSLNANFLLFLLIAQLLIYWIASYLMPQGTELVAYQRF